MPDVYITLNDGDVHHSMAFSDKVNADYDEHGVLTGIEVLNAQSVDIDVTTPTRLVVEGLADDGTRASGNHTPTV